MNVLSDFCFHVDILIMFICFVLIFPVLVYAGFPRVLYGVCAKNALKITAYINNNKAQGVFWEQIGTFKMLSDSALAFSLSQYLGVYF